MKINYKMSGLAALVGGVLGIGGCFEGQFNKAPEIEVAELNGNTLNPTFIGKITDDNECDVIYDITIPRGDFLKDEFRLSVKMKDKDGPEPLRVSNYPMKIGEKVGGELVFSESDLAVSSYNGQHERNSVEYNVLISPRDNEVSLGLHRLVIGASDGIFANEQNYCFNFNVFAGDTVPPGEMPQTPIDDGNGGNGNMTCYSDSDCDMHEMCQDGSCVVREPQLSDLNKLAMDACTSLSRP